MDGVWYVINVNVSALEVFFKNEMRYINPRFTYLLNAGNCAVQAAA